MNHSFDIKHAEMYGINAAIILENIIFWTKKNDANEHNVIDGYVWVFNSVSAWKQLFPYMGESQIKTALKKLEDAEVLISGNHNKVAYDRTKWYAIIDQSILENNQIHMVVLANGTNENSQPIPSINTPIITTEKKKSDIDSFFEFLESKVKYKSKVTRTKDSKKLFDSIEDKKKLALDYIKHQEEKGEYAIRITAYMKDYNTAYKNNTPGKRKKEVLI